LGAGDEDEHEALGPHSPVFDGHLESNPMWNVLGTAALREPNPVSRKPVACEDALFLVEEARSARRIVGHEEVDNSCSNDRCKTFKDLLRISISG